MSEDARRRREEPDDEFAPTELVETVRAHEPATLDELAAATDTEPEVLRERLEDLTGRGVLLSMDRATGRVWMSRDA